jgi:hypothetical protein
LSFGAYRAERCQNEVACETTDQLAKGVAKKLTLERVDYAMNALGKDKNMANESDIEKEGTTIIVELAKALCCNYAPVTGEDQYLRHPEEWLNRAEDIAIRLSGKVVLLSKPTYDASMRKMNAMHSVLKTVARVVGGEQLTEEELQKVTEVAKEL